MENADLRRLQLLELKLANEIKRVCEKLNIKYFLIGGTFLGAVRHKGFIPWDDDMDIGMLRKDYERFMKCAPKEIGSEFFLQNWDSDSDYPFSFGKLRLNGTMVVEKMNAGTNSHKGVFVDIFPFDNVPDSKKEQKRHARRIFLFKKLMWIKKGYGKALQKENLKLWLKYNAGWLLSCLWSYDRLKSDYYRELTKYNNQKTKYVFDSCLYSYQKSQAEWKWFESLVLYEFEGEYYYAPKKYDEYLSHLYGDYMQLPPEDKRHTHEIQALSFDA